MEKISMHLAAALIMTTVPIFAASPSFAQEKERGDAVIEKGQSSSERSRPAESRKDSESKSEKSAQPAENNDRGKSSERAGSKSEADDKNPAGKTKSADDREKSDTSADRKSQPDDKAAQSREKRRDETETKDSSDSKDAKDNDRKKAERPSPAPDQTARESKDSGKPSTEANGEATEGREKPDKVRSVDLSGDRRERVATTFRNEANVKRITNVNVEISIGRRLPREWEYYPVPTTIIAVVPEYRGYRYAYVEDRYVIVDPDTYEVVYVLETSGRSARGGGGDECSSSISLSEEDRIFVIEKVRRTSASASIRVGDLSIGFKLPGSARVETFPSEVTSRVSKLESCRYVVVEDRVAIIDPREDKVISILE